MSEDIEFSIEVVEPFTKALTPESVVELDGIKTYSTPAVIADLRNSHLNFRSGRVSFDNPIPVKSDDGRTIGYASVEERDGKLVGLLSIDYATPERLSLETRSERLFAWAVGQIRYGYRWREDAGFIDFIGRRMDVEWYDIYAIVLRRIQPEPNALAVGEAIL